MNGLERTVFPTADLAAHPAAASFPMMDDKRFGELKADIEARGQLERIIVLDGEILDGRNRYKACRELGIKPDVREVVGVDPWLYVWSLNGERRDLVGEQRYLIWKHCHEQSDAWQLERQRIADEANAKRSAAAKEQPRTKSGFDRKEQTPDQRWLEWKKKQEADQVVAQSVLPPADNNKERQAKAAASKTNAGAVHRGDLLAKHRPDLAEQVRQGEMKPAEAHRTMKRDQVADKVAELPPDKYRVLYADPPWSYNDAQGGEISASYGGAEKHYPTMSMAELRALDVPSLAAPDAVLFLWATSPLLPDAFDLIGAWGFKYKAAFVWDKVKHNMGHYNSVRHELLLIATRGSCTPDNVKLFDSVQSIERTEHSRKPAEFREIIETLYTQGKRIELFARSQNDGWECWGNEA